MFIYELNGLICIFMHTLRWQMHTAGSYHIISYHIIYIYTHLYIYIHIEMTDAHSWLISFINLVIQNSEKISYSMACSIYWSADFYLFFLIFGHTAHSYIDIEILLHRLKHTRITNSHRCRRHLSDFPVTKRSKALLISSKGSSWVINSSSFTTCKSRVITCELNKIMHASVHTFVYIN